MMQEGGRDATSQPQFVTVLSGQIFRVKQGNLASSPLYFRSRKYAIDSWPNVDIKQVKRADDLSNSRYESWQSARWKLFLLDIFRTSAPSVFSIPVQAAGENVTFFIYLGEYTN